MTQGAARRIVAKADGISNFQAVPADTEAGIVAPRTALIVVDMINHQVTPGTGLLKQFADVGVPTDYMIKRTTELVVPNIDCLIDTARRAGVAVVFLRVGATGPHLRDALPAGRDAMRGWGAVEGTWGCEVIPALAPQPGDLSLLKLGSGGFGTSNLDQHLRFMGIDTLIYTGVLTNACVLLTIAGGFDLGYRGYMVKDATATTNPELQEATEAIVAAMMAQVVTTKEMLGSLNATDRQVVVANAGSARAGAS